MESQALGWEALGLWWCRQVAAAWGGGCRVRLPEALWGPEAPAREVCGCPGAKGTERCVGVADWIPRPGSDGARAPCPGKGGKRKPSEFPCYARIFAQAHPGSG